MEPIDRSHEHGIQRLAYEIRIKRNATLDLLDKRDKLPTRVKVSDIRQNIYELQGMVYAYLYVTGRWTHNETIILNEESNNMVMLYTSVDLIKMYERANTDIKVIRERIRQDRINH
jgi:hypothetical protein